MATDEEVREAEQAVIEGSRRALSTFGQVPHALDELGDLVAQLDALKSPLPTRDELEEAAEGMATLVDGSEVAECGPFWLRWVASLPEEKRSPSSLIGWAIELEVRDE